MVPNKEYEYKHKSTDGITTTILLAFTEEFGQSPKCDPEVHHLGFFLSSFLPPTNSPIETCTHTKKIRWGRTTLGEEEMGGWRLGLNGWLLQQTWEWRGGGCSTWGREEREDRGWRPKEGRGVAAHKGP
jgi:hypothetical protein